MSFFEGGAGWGRRTSFDRSMKGIKANKFRAPSPLRLRAECIQETIIYGSSGARIESAGNARKRFEEPSPRVPSAARRAPFDLAPFEFHSLHRAVPPYLLA